MFTVAEGCPKPMPLIGEKSPVNVQLAAQAPWNQTPSKRVNGATTQEPSER